MLAARVAAGTDAEIDVTVQIYAHDGDAATRSFVESLGVLPASQQAPLGSGTASYRWAPILAFANLALRVRVADIPALAERADVTFVGARLPTTLMDEKQALLLSGDPAPGPASPSYLDFLAGRGFSTNPVDYPVVDVTDSTIDEGGSGATRARHGRSDAAHGGRSFAAGAGRLLRELLVAPRRSGRRRGRPRLAQRRHHRGLRHAQWLPVPGRRRPPARSWHQSVCTRRLDDDLRWLAGLVRYRRLQRRRSGHRARERRERSPDQQQFLGLRRDRRVQRPRSGL